MLAAPARDGQDPLTCSMTWKFNPHATFLCLKRGLPLTSNVGKYAYDQVAHWSAHVYVEWLAVYESSFDYSVVDESVSPQRDSDLVAEVMEREQDVPSRTTCCWARRREILKPTGVFHVKDVVVSDSPENALSVPGFTATCQVPCNGMEWNGMYWNARSCHVMSWHAMPSHAMSCHVL